MLIPVFSERRLDFILIYDTSHVSLDVNKQPGGRFLLFFFLGILTHPWTLVHSGHSTPDTAPHCYHHRRRLLEEAHRYERSADPVECMDLRSTLRAKTHEIRQNQQVIERPIDGQIWNSVTVAGCAMS